MTENYNKLIDKEEIANDPYAREHPEAVGCLVIIGIAVMTGVMAVIEVSEKIDKMKIKIDKLLNEKDTTSTD